MKVSIITVCFNSAKTLQKTIDSVKSQTYLDIEYIIVDGKSTDATVDIINSNEEVITKWISEPDKGLYDAMNKGVEMATGNIVGILNSDDTFYNDKTINDIVEFHNNTEIDASIGNIIQHNEKGKVTRTYSSKNWNPEKLKIGFMPPHPSIFFKKELFDRYGVYKLNYKIGADYELIIRFFLKNNIIWKYSGITTTSMLIGGVSSSGFGSYKNITREIQKALTENKVSFNKFKIISRVVWKIKELF